MRIYYPHAWYSYQTLNWKHYSVAIFDICIAKMLGAVNLNFHLPLEILFVSQLDIPKAKTYIKWVEWVASIFKVNVVWENIVMLNTSDWSFKERPIFDHIPKDIDLCLDVGHLILGSTNPSRTVSNYVKKFGPRIKHLHVHENNLKRDLHLQPGKAISFSQLKKITANRTWMYEPSS